MHVSRTVRRLAAALLLILFVVTTPVVVLAGTAPQAATPTWVVVAWHVAAPLLIGFACWLGAGVLNWLLWWEAQEDWTKWAGTNPRKALVVRLIRLVGPHLRAFAEAWSKYLAAQAARRGVDPAKVSPPAAPTPPPNASA